MRIGVDLDSTLCDTSSVLIQLTNFKFGTKYTLEDINSWDFWRNAGPEMEAAFWKIYDYMDTLYLRRAMPPVDPLACPIVKMLERKGHTVKILTANSPEARKGIESWLFGHGLDTDVQLMGRISPGEKIKLDFDLFIDDSPKLIDPIRLEPKKQLVLLTQPWNAKIDVSRSKNIYRAKDWRDIQRYLEKRRIL